MLDPQTFTVTGFIDWDDVFVGPREGGYARYLSWITRDWDPIMYGWPPGSITHEEDSNHDQSMAGKRVPKDDEPVQNGFSCEEPPEVLQAHQDLYYAIYADVDPIGAEVTCRSHIFEAVAIALEHRDLSTEIMSKLCSHLFGKEYMGMGELLFGIEAGDWFVGMRGVRALRSET
ncbi:uncharacterized protein ARMOST_12606 [Armillaria ostoyae]|uniref:Aminoglycoside phosphotransferase domain-containing protein n=1 Tax=Armillaria ostoyae TaxID=47428 RepID=A0A284RKE5_ARMOS|nr:uncharacterized protein ARMOST_12606 [Armillaria ostoyae]